MDIQYPCQCLNKLVTTNFILPSVGEDNRIHWYISLYAQGKIPRPLSEIFYCPCCGTKI
jgi:hypothetical protein